MGARPRDHITPALPRRGTSAAAVLSLFALVLVALTVGAGAAAPARAATAKGIVDWRLEAPEGISDLSTIQPIVDEMGPNGLDAKFTRVYFRWARLQPYAPGTTYAADGNGDGYDDAYVAELEAVVGAFKAAGIKVIMTGTDCPRWASDTRYSGSAQGAAVVPAIDKPRVKTAWQYLARYLAEHFGLIGARYFEVWNEPNLSSGLYPQLYGAKKTPVGPAVYLKMLKAFSTAAHKADKGAVVIAGATSRRGANDAHSTSPQWFATYLKDHGGAKYLDAYSHHPYTPPGASPAPGAVPKGAAKAVTLGNIGALLKIFPTKPFYLTEYGLSTDVHDLFCVVVSRDDQAKYLRQAYALVSRKPQIKAMVWFLLQDFVQDPVTLDGVYSGLDDQSGRPKPAWYAFAGKPAP